MELHSSLSARVSMHILNVSSYDHPNRSHVQFSASNMEPDKPSNQPIGNTTLLSLPAEIRLAIFEYTFQDNAEKVGFRNHNVPGGVVVDERYFASNGLALLLTCRQLYQDASLIAMSKTPFMVSNLFSQVPDRLSVLHPKQQSAIRHLSFAADARHFRRFVDWNPHAFGMTDLNLDTLTVVLHQSTTWHYLFDFTYDIVRMLRTLCNVKRFVFVRNAARVKGSFKTWYNRLVGLIMKVDHQQRYERSDPKPEDVWWDWEFDDLGQRICLDARPPREMVEEEVYLEGILPHMEALRRSIESEEFNPDPRSRMMYY